MLKLKGVDILSLDTLRTGLIVYFRVLVLGFLLRIIPFGSLLMPNLTGWAASDLYGNSAKFLSKSNFSVGLNILWRYIAFMIPLLAVWIALGDWLSNSKLGSLVLILLLLMFGIIAMGWAAKRVELILREKGMLSDANEDLSDSEQELNRKLELLGKLEKMKKL